MLFLFHPVVVSIVCPTGPNPPLRLQLDDPTGVTQEGGVGPPPAEHADDVFIATYVQYQKKTVERQTGEKTKSGDTYSKHRRPQGATRHCTEVKHLS